MSDDVEVGECYPAGVGKVITHAMLDHLAVMRNLRARLDKEYPRGTFEMNMARAQAFSRMVSDHFRSIREAKESHG